MYRDLEGNVLAVKLLLDSLSWEVRKQIKKLSN